MAEMPLDTPTLETILATMPRLRIGIVGDLFLDRYLDIDAALTEPSLETGLDAYQVVGVRSSPGAAGTVLNNLIALGVGRVYPIAVVGEDGEGHELRQNLNRLSAVDSRALIVSAERRTPTYTKPMLHAPGQPPRELNRLDIKNRVAMPPHLEEEIQRQLVALWPQLDALVALDQVSEADCGVITANVRAKLAELAAAQGEKTVLADSRERIGCFRGVCLKPNRRETLRALNYADTESDEVLAQGITRWARRTGRFIFCTDGANGIRIGSPFEGPDCPAQRIPAYPVSGPIDVVGAGDSTSAALVCALAAGVNEKAAAAFANLVASITIQQIGTTGTATPEQIWQRWRDSTPF